VKAVRAHGRGGPEHLLFLRPYHCQRFDVGMCWDGTRDWHHARGTALTWDATYQNADGRPRIPGIAGHEISELVERMAEDVTDFRRAHGAFEHGATSHAPGKIVLQVLASRAQSRTDGLR
jgi:hypothetical protein